MSTEGKNKRIRFLNDDLRRMHRGGQVVITSGIQSLGNEAINHVLNAVATFDDFNGDNDPHAEHDCATLEAEGRKIMFKLDYYDPTMQYHSEDPADPIKTRRVLTILLAEEY